MSVQIYSVVSVKGGERRVVMETSNVFQAFQLITRLMAAAWEGEPDPVKFLVIDADGNTTASRRRHRMSNNS